MLVYFRYYFWKGICNSSVVSSWLFILRFSLFEQQFGRRLLWNSSLASRIIVVASFVIMDIVVIEFNGIETNCILMDCKLSGTSKYSLLLSSCFWGNYWSTFGVRAEASARYRYRLKQMLKPNSIDIRNICWWEIYF